MITQNTARNLMVLMVDSTSHVTGLAGLTLTITASKDGAAFASISPTVTDRSNGWYNLALTSAMTDTLGDLCIQITGTAADPSSIREEVVPPVIDAVVNGVSDSGTTTTMVDAARVEADTDYWKGSIILFTSGTIAGQSRLITAFTPGSDTITFTPATTQAVSTQSYEIIPAGRADVGLWNGTAPSALISGRVDANAQVVGTGAIVAGSFTASAIDATAIAANAITSAKIATDAIGASQLAANAITSAKIATDAITSTQIAASAVTELRATVTGTASSGSTTTIVDAGRTEADTDYWKGSWILITSGTSAGQVRLITGFNAGTDTLTFAPALTQAITTNTYEIIRAAAVDVGLWAASVPNALVSGRVDSSVGAVAANAITAASIATDAIDSDAIAASAVTEIQSGLATSASIVTLQADTDDIQTRLPAALVSGRIDASVGAMAANVLTATAINTGAITAAKFAADSIDSAALAASAVTEIQTGLATSASIVTLQGDTDDIQTRLPAALVSGRIDASVGAMAAGVVTAAAVATGAIDADALATDAVTEIRSIVSGTSDSGTTTTMVDAARTEGDTDYWKGAWILFTSGNLAGQCRLITGFNAGTDTLTYTPATTQAAATQNYEILPNGAIDVGLWAASAPNALVSGRVDASVGAVAANAITAASIATDAIDSDAIAASAVTEIQNGLATSAALATVQADTDDIQTRLPAALVSGRIDASVGAMAANVLTATSINAAAITAAKFATDALDANALAASAVTEIQSGLATAAALTTVQADTDDIQTRLPAALVSGRMDSSVGAMAAGVVTAAAVATGAIDADALATDAVTEIRSIVSGTSDSGTTTTMVDAARTEADADYWKGAWILFTSGNIAGQCRLITAFNAGTDTITYTPATTQAAATQNYEILPNGAIDVGLWAASAPNALASGRVDASVGAVANNAITAASIATDAIDSDAIAASAVTEIQSGLATSASIVTLQADTDDIQTRLPAALVSGRIDASVGAVANNAITAAAIATGAIDADALASDAVTEIRSVASGTSDSGTTTTMVDAARTEGDADYWKGCRIVFTSGTIAGQVRLITAFNAGTDTITFSPATTQTVGTQTYEILPAGGVDLRLWNGSAPSNLISGRVDANAQALAAAVISAASFAAGAIDAAAIATDAIDSDALATSAVNEIRDAILGGTIAELAQAQPPTTPTVAEAIALLYMAIRNASQSTASERRIMNNAGTVVCKAPLSDNGTTFDQGKLVTGP